MSVVSQGVALLPGGAYSLKSLPAPAVPSPYTLAECASADSLSLAMQATHLGRYNDGLAGSQRTRGRLRCQRMGLFPVFQVEQRGQLVAHLQT